MFLFAIVFAMVVKPTTDGMGIVVGAGALLLPRDRPDAARHRAHAETRRLDGLRRPAGVSGRSRSRRRSTRRRPRRS